MRRRRRLNRKGPWKYNPTDEPNSDALGYEGAARAEENRAISALLLHYQLTHEQASLDLVNRLVNFVLKPVIWTANDDEKRYPGREHGIWSGHFHNGTQGLNSLLDLAVVTHSEWMKQFVREYYENTHRNGIVRMGFYPAWSSPERFKSDSSLGEIPEPCALGDMAVDGVRMSDAGLGDYWDDVDYLVRNHLVESQFTDFDKMRHYVGVKEGSIEEANLRKMVGGFYNCTPTRIKGNVVAACCNANGAQGLYYAWHGITRFDEQHQIATVNLFLNRSSAWMDVDSYLPYEGKVVLHNKQAKMALVRIPGWVDRTKLSCRIERRGLLGPHGITIANPPYNGNYLMLAGLKAKDDIVLEFPVSMTTDHYTIAGNKYTVTYKGSTIVDITPRESGNIFQVYERDFMKANKTPMRQVKRFVADRIIPLGAF